MTIKRRHHSDVARNFNRGGGGRGGGGMNYKVQLSNIYLFGTKRQSQKKGASYNVPIPHYASGFQPSDLMHL